MKQMELATCIYLLMEIDCWLHVVLVLIFMIYLFTSSKWCQQQQSPPASHHLFLFTYGNWLLIACGFPFNIHDLFVYFFTAKSTIAAQVTTCFYLLMEIGYWLHVVFLFIFMIYLFTSSQRSQQQQRKSPSVFIYLCKLLVYYRWFSF